MGRKPCAQHRFLFLDRRLRYSEFAQQRGQGGWLRRCGADVAGMWGCDCHGCPLWRREANSRSGDLCAEPFAREPYRPWR